MERTQKAGAGKRVVGYRRWGKGGENQGVCQFSGPIQRENHPQALAWGGYHKGLQDSRTTRDLCDDPITLFIIAHTNFCLVGGSAEPALRWVPVILGTMRMPVRRALRPASVERRSTFQQATTRRNADETRYLDTVLLAMNGFPLIRGN